MKKHHIITILLGMTFMLSVATSQEITQALRYTNGISTLPLAGTGTEPITLEPLVIQSGDTDTNAAIAAREKELLYAGGGFEGDGQKTIPVKEGMYILVAGVLVYALIARRRLRL